MRTLQYFVHKLGTNNGVQRNGRCAARPEHDLHAQVNGETRVYVGHGMGHARGSEQSFIEANIESEDIHPAKLH